MLRRAGIVGTCILGVAVGLRHASRLALSAVGLLYASACGGCPGQRLAPPRHADPYRACRVGAGCADCATFAAQIHQESTWRESITAPDDGRGLAQFMDSTAGWLVQRYPALGKADPYNPAWAMRALVRYDRHLVNQVRGADPCQRMAAALKGYNAGVGYVLRARVKSTEPGVWFGVTEHIQTGQSAKNFRSIPRRYPHWIIYKHQPRYVAAGFGKGVCA